MNSHPEVSDRGFFRWTWLLLVATASFGHAAGPATAAGPQSLPPAQARMETALTGAVSSAAPAGTPPACLLADHWWHQPYTALESVVHNRAGMIRFGMIGMALALFIIWWRK